MFVQPCLLLFWGCCLFQRRSFSVRSQKGQLPRLFNWLLCKAISSEKCKGNSIECQQKLRNFSVVGAWSFLRARYLCRGSQTLKAGSKGRLEIHLERLWIELVFVTVDSKCLMLEWMNSFSFILYNSRWRDMRLRKTTAKPFGLSLDHPDTTAWFLRQMPQPKRFNLLAFFWTLILCTSWTFSACISILASFSTSGKFTGFSGWKIQTFTSETVDKIWKHDQSIEILYLSGPQRTQLDNGNSWFDTTEIWLEPRWNRMCTFLTLSRHSSPPATLALTLWPAWIPGKTLDSTTDISFEELLRKGHYHANNASKTLPDRRTSGQIWFSNLFFSIYTCYIPSFLCFSGFRLFWICGTYFSVYIPCIGSWELSLHASFWGM